MLSFRKIKIVKKFSDDTCIKLTIKDKQKKFQPYNDDTHLDLQDDSSHYLGILFTNCISMNKLHNLTWNKNQVTTYLNYTNLFLYNGMQYPVVKIENDEFNKGFKYKKFIRKYIDKAYNLKKKDIMSIKLYKTHKNLHNYVVVLNSVFSLKNGLNSMVCIGETYSWRNFLDMFKLENPGVEPTQQQIYNLILNYKSHIDLHNYQFYPKKEDIELPKYILEYSIKYKNLIEILKTINFN